MRELAEYLKSQRLERGLTLRVVSERVRISVDMLQVLEEGGYEQIGTALLIRGFVRAYCEALGIDPLPLLEKYEAEILACDRQDESIKRYGTWSKSISVTRRLGFWGLLLLVALMIGVLCGGVWLFKKKIRLAETEMSAIPYPQQDYPADLPKGPVSREEIAKVETHEDRGSGKAGTAPSKMSPEESRDMDAHEPVGRLQEPASVREAPGSDNPSLVLAEDMPAESPQKPTQVLSVHRLEVAADQKTWMQVKLDDGSTHSALLQPGDKRVWETKTSMSVVVGNAGGVRMRWDDKPVGSDGKPGQVLRFRLPDAALADATKPPM
jgi:cytoskeleton protein RodZ